MSDETRNMLADMDMGEDDDIRQVVMQLKREIEMLKTREFRPRETVDIRLANGKLSIGEEGMNVSSSLITLEWWKTISASITGSGKAIYAVCYDPANDCVYVAGDFTAIDGVAANYIAKYDIITDTWSALGSGMNGIVRALCLDASGNLVVGGGFTTGNGVTLNRLGYWNGSTFVAYGSGMNGIVYALCLNALGNLVVGGSFTTGNGVTLNYLGYWNGSTFVAYGSGMNNDVRALTLDGSGNLVAGGVFTTGNGVTLNYLGYWNGSTFVAYGSGMNNFVYALCLGEFGNLVVGGGFTTGDGVTLNRLGRWNGTTFIPYGSGLSGLCNAVLLTSSGELIVGGNFVTADNVTVNYLARWDGSTFIPYGSGLNDFCYALAFADTDLVIGGDFTVVDGRLGMGAALLKGEETLEAILKYLSDGDRVVQQSAKQWATQFITAVTVSLVENNAFAGGFYRGPSAANANDGDEYNFQFVLEAGTYSMNVYGGTNSACGKVDFYLDGADTPFSTDQDWYAALGPNPAMKTVTGVVIPFNGRHTLKVKVNGKNASSTDYRWLNTFICFTPAAYSVGI